MDAKQKQEIADQIDVVLALAGEDVDGPAARAAALRRIGEGDFSDLPEKRGEQIEWMNRLAEAVLSDIGQAPLEQQKTGARVEKEGWDADTEGAPVIRSPIG